MVHRRVYTAVEEAIDPLDPSILWYYIPGFNGYEVSNTNMVRSMKHYHRYPFGILIKPVMREPYGSSCDPLFELSDNNNIRVKIRLSQLVLLAHNNQYAVSGYPRHTCISDPTSRNDIHFVKKKIPMLDKTAKYGKFTVVQDGTEMPKMSYQGPQLVIPIQSIDDRLNKNPEYFGRKEARVTCHFTIQENPGGEIPNMYMDESVDTDSDRDISNETGNDGTKLGYSRRYLKENPNAGKDIDINIINKIRSNMNLKN